MNLFNTPPTQMPIVDHIIADGRSYWISEEPINSSVTRQMKLENEKKLINQTKEKNDI